jgi:hypothetical protein
MMLWGFALAPLRFGLAWQSGDPAPRQHRTGADDGASGTAEPSDKRRSPKAAPCRNSLSSLNARGGTRTRMGSPPGDFKSAPSDVATCDKPKNGATSLVRPSNGRTDAHRTVPNGGRLVTAAVTASHASTPPVPSHTLSQPAPPVPSRPRCRSRFARAAKAPQAPREAAGRTVASGASETAFRRAEEARPLGNNANNVSARDAAAKCRSLRHRLREVARPFQRNVNARKCGRVPHAGSVEIRRRVEDGTAHYHGLVRCGSWHSCPLCGLQIAMHRAKEVRGVADAHRATGGGVYLLTLTLPHDQGDRLQPLYEAVADSYRFARSGAAWYRMKDAIGYVGEIRALEVTVGPHGWHPHLHVLLLTARPLTAEQLDELSYFHRRWSDRIVRFGYRAPSQEHGVTIVESHRDDYLAKMGLADELTMGAHKNGRDGSRTPLEVLAGFASTGDTVDLEVWREYTLAMHGARQLTWSRGLRERYAVETEKTDAEVVAGESDGAEEEIALIAPDTWQLLLRADRDVTWRLLDAAESGGADAVDLLIERTLAITRRRVA